MAITAARMWGGGYDLGSISADATIYRGVAKCWSIVAGSAGLKVKMEVPTAPVYARGVIFFVWNRGATNSFVLANAAGTTFATVGVGQFARVRLWDMTGNGTWTARVETFV